MEALKSLVIFKAVQSVQSDIKNNIKPLDSLKMVENLLIDGIDISVGSIENKIFINKHFKNIDDCNLYDLVLVSKIINANCNATSMMMNIFTYMK